MKKVQLVIHCPVQTLVRKTYTVDLDNYPALAELIESGRIVEIDNPNNSRAAQETVEDVLGPDLAGDILGEADGSEWNGDEDSIWDEWENGGVKHLVAGILRE
jgi:hypothetical protein